MCVTGSDKVMSGKLDIKRCFPGFKWLILPLALLAVISISWVIAFENSDPVKSLKQCEQQRENDSSRLTMYQEKLADALSSLKLCESQSARQHDRIKDLEKRVKALEQLNRNLTMKHQQLDDEIQKCQERSNQCHREVDLINNKLNTIRKELRQCQLDRNECRNLRGQANTMHRIHVGLIALSIMFLKLLY